MSTVSIAFSSQTCFVLFILFINTNCFWKFSYYIIYFRVHWSVVYLERRPGPWKFGTLTKMYVAQNGGILPHSFSQCKVFLIAPMKNYGLQMKFSDKISFIFPLLRREFSRSRVKTLFRPVSTGEPGIRLFNQFSLLDL